MSNFLKLSFTGVLLLMGTSWSNDKSAEELPSWGELLGAISNEREALVKKYKSLQENWPPAFAILVDQYLQAPNKDKDSSTWEMANKIQSGVKKCWARLLPDDAPTLIKIVNAQDIDISMRFYALMVLSEMRTNDAFLIEIIKSKKDDVLSAYAIMAVALRLGDLDIKKAVDERMANARFEPGKINVAFHHLSRYNKLIDAYGKCENVSKKFGLVYSNYPCSAMTYKISMPVRSLMPEPISYWAIAEWYRLSKTSPQEAIAFLQSQLIKPPENEKFDPDYTRGKITCLIENSPEVVRQEAVRSGLVKEKVALTPIPETTVALGKIETYMIKFLSMYKTKYNLSECESTIIAEDVADKMEKYKENHKRDYEKIRSGKLNPDEKEKLKKQLEDGEEQILQELKNRMEELLKKAKAAQTETDKQ